MPVVDPTPKPLPMAKPTLIDAHRAAKPPCWALSDLLGVEPKPLDEEHDAVPEKTGRRY